VRTWRKREFLACTGYPECKNTQSFKRNEEGKIQVIEETNTGHVCEKCGLPMVIKRGRRGEFLACSGYPKCKNAKDFRKEEDGTIKIAVPVEAGEQEICDKCGKPMVVKRGPRGPFLACTGYPECKNTKRIAKPAKEAEPPTPTDEVCEKCGKPMVIRKGRFGPFLACTGYPKCKNARKIETDKPPKEEK
jgi:DNA topoisomerase I